MMQSLDKDLRSALEKTVKAARTVAETAANAAVNQLGVGHDKPEAFLSDSEKVLRNRLRTHGKQLGDVRDSNSTNPTYGKQEVQHLVQEVAYQHWHRMLFARFLADNNLLMYDGVAVTVEECDELAPDEGAKSGWELAGKLAARMLPQVFKPGSPVFELSFAPEHQSELELLLKALPDAVFKASDSLGWVYQFWQADNKERINKSEVKIGADELPAVTQLFTEPYMVAFLLHNSLGAWWAVRHPGTPCPIKLDYLRTLDNGTPAAGKFEGWPDSLASFKLIDPCCGSGHFLVAAFMMLVPMRMAAEGLSAKEAVNRVLAENIHGLELDPRCVEIAVFAVALEAWRYPDTSGNPIGVREIPVPNIACCGLKVATRAEDWETLASEVEFDSEGIREGLRRLHADFSQAPLLGSLLNPGKLHKGDLFSASYDKLKVLLEKALSTETAGQREKNNEIWDFAVAASGLMSAAQLLTKKYHLVITNVPYLGLRKQSETLKEYCEKNYPNESNDLATVFIARCLDLVHDNKSYVAVVSPQNWLFQARYKEFRKSLLDKNTLRMIIRLGSGAFETITGEVVKATLAILQPNSAAGEFVTNLDVANAKGIQDKVYLLKNSPISLGYVKDYKSAPDFRIVAGVDDQTKLLSDFATILHGQNAGDNPRFSRYFWEVPKLGTTWELYQLAASSTGHYLGRSQIVRWEKEKGEMYRLAESVKHLNHKAQQWRSGKPNWGKQGVAVSLVGKSVGTLYTGEIYGVSCGVVIPKKQEYLGAIWSFVESGEFSERLKEIDPSLAISVKTVLAVPFDINQWQESFDSKYPNGLPTPRSDDPTQWLFHGHPEPCIEALQVAVARLVGYNWPSETGDGINLSDSALDWISKSKALETHEDKDGIVCIPAVGTESSASDRLLNLFADAYRDAWSTDTLSRLLKAADHAGKSLEAWLRDKFFTQHCKLFGNRPFVWHVWDGLSDGFAALLNYHRLDYKTLETLIYSHLGDWISRQKRDAENRVDGAHEKLAAAEGLKKRLELILAGQAPYDIFVRWKPIEEQPISWNPDLNDGVRLNIRPFLSVPDVGKRGAGVLRDKPNIKWDKDRGSDVPSAPWYELGLQYDGKVGDRINDHHLTLAAKIEARGKATSDQVGQ